MAVRMPPVPTIAEGLSLAMVAASDSPLLLLDGDLVVIAISDSFCLAFNVDPGATVGSSMLALGSGEWNLPQLRSLLTATASRQAALEAYEMDLKRPGRVARRLVIKARRLEYGEPEAVRLLVTVSDVTEARLADKFRDDLVRDKAVLLQEVQHRVANSLQIIASVLLQTARNVRSEETRSHLQDAHNRVMSIATVQKQLSASAQGDVELRPYFVQLCQSLGASMIRDHKRQSIEVSGDRSKVSADVSIGLGLIVTELVINALKHAFPENRPGKILVDFQSQGPNWRLSVSDNGVGMPSGQARAVPGLGTSIVEALARQLRATVRLADTKTGTAVSIDHTPIAAIDSADARPSELAV